MSNGIYPDGTGLLHMRASDDELARWLTAALTLSGMSKAELGRKMSLHFRRPIDRQMVYKMTKGVRAIPADELEFLRETLAPLLPIPEKRFTVELVGHVQAGGNVILLDQGAQRIELVPAPPEATAQMVALRVEGDSLYPMARDGSVLYYDAGVRLIRPDMLGDLCIVGLHDGRVLAKILESGSQPGLYDLRAPNAATLKSLAVEWASPVTFVKLR